MVVYIYISSSRTLFWFCECVCVSLLQVYIMDQDMFIYSDESEQDEDYFSDADDDDYSHEARNTTDCDCDVNDNDNGNDIAPPHSTINTIDNTTTMVKTTTTTTRQTNNNDSDNDNDIKQKGKQKQQYIENNSNSNDDFFSIMDSSKLRSAQAAAIHDVMSICCVSESIAFQLLKHYQWSNVSHAVEEWFTKEDQLRKTLGLGHNTDSDNDGTNTNFFNNSCTNSRHDSWSDTTNNTHVSSDMAIDINNTINKEENENKAIHFIKCGICLEMCPESDLISSPACDGIKCDSNRPISSSSGTLDSSSNNNNNNNEALCDTERSMKTTESSSSQSQPHLFCHSCYYEYVRSAVSDGPANCLTLTCPMPQCKTLLPISFIKTCLRYTNKDDGKYSHGSSKSIPMPTTYTEGDRMRDRFERFMLESYVNDNASIKWCPAPNCEMAIKINNKNMNSKNKTQRRRSDSRRSLSRSKSIQISSNNPNHNNNGSSVSFSLSPRSDFYCNSNTSNANNNSAGGFASSMEDAEILQDCVDFSDDSSDDEGCPNASPSQKHLPCCRCSCGFSFCYTCGSEYHSPVSCSIVRQWQLKCANEADNLNWILENAKPCPSCSRPIEKNHGCMHMTCSVCKHEFCWLCGEPWSVHSQKTGGFYACNRYKTNNNNNNNNNGNQTLSRQVGEVRRNTTSIYTNTSINTNMAGNYASRAILGRRVEDATNTTTTNGSLSRLIDYADLGADGDEVLLERRRQQEEERLLFGGPSTGTSDNNASNTTTTTTTTTNGNGIDMTSIGNVTIQNIDRGGASSSGTNNNNTKNGWNWTANSTINNNTMNMNRISSKPSRYGKNNGSIFGSRNDDNDEHSLQRYLHYYERYNAHEKARVQAQQQHDYVELGIISNNNTTTTRRGKKAVNASVLLWRLHTGRTHQIRVHAAHIGHPIIGDDLYVSNTTTTSKKIGGVDNGSIIARPALHAKTLGFIHPRTGEEMMFTADLPEDMKNLIEELS